MTLRVLAFAAAAIIVSGTAAGTAAAQDFKTKQAGDIVVRARGIGILPNEGGTVRTRDTHVDTGIRIDRITDEWVPELDFSYFIKPYLALELIAATARHQVTTDTGIDVGKVSHLPPTLTLQFHPFPASRVSPYVGAGINYTWFYDVKPGPAAAVQDLGVENTFGWALQAGVDIAIAGGWHVNIDAKRLWLRPDVTTTALRVDDFRIDPWIVGAGIGYRF